MLLASVTGLAGCGGAAEGLTVFGAASLRDVLAAEVAAEPGRAVRVSTGGSNLLVEQLLAGAEADVVVAASAAELERLVAAGLVAPGDVRRLFTNRLVVIAPRGSAAELVDFFDAEGGRVALAHPTAVPAGRYARAWLEQRGAWDALAPRVLQALDVRAALAAVESGGAAFGVVYATDARTSDRVRVVHFVEDGPRPEYVGGVLASGGDLEAARAFLASLDALGADRAAPPATAARLEAAGFGVEPADDSAGMGSTGEPVHEGPR